MRLAGAAVILGGGLSSCAWKRTAQPLAGAAGPSGPVGMAAGQGGDGGKRGGHPAEELGF